ncbi:tetratricopeptide repeat protein [Sporolactobacillus sp. CPB3-1]|uniref:Tetratricopeptide repeat protein n=1 Tax=Sporolactobacillus mangiferae TaxID=2940498 RepID=A0ABT0MB44_9BACL|nr:tetratricopeptide repeat protein [Sporolactobacillus mangiferae]MCL1631828.1 tetratricopeptide repeat protein [Sporolactobacillus mangiferae]
MYAKWIFLEVVSQVDYDDVSRLLSGFLKEMSMIRTLETANALMGSGQTEEGIKLLRDLAVSGDDQTQFGAASIFQQYGFLDDARKVYERLLTRFPDDSELILQLSELLIDKNEESLAIHYLEKVPPLDENYLSAQVMLADLFQLEGLVEVAEHKLLGALKRAPHQPILILALGELYLSAGEAGKAVDCFMEVKDNPELSKQNVPLKLAEALSLSGNFEASIDEYEKGLKNEKTLDGLFGYAVTAMRVHKHRKAIKALETLKSMDPGYSTLYNVLAEAYEHEGNLKKALATVQAGLEQDEYNERLYVSGGILSAKLHQNDQAVHYFRKCLALNPENMDALLHLTELMAQEEDYEGVIRLLGNTEIEDPMLIWFLATAYNQTDELKKAEAHYRRCASVFSANPDFLQEYGEFLREIGQMNEGLNLLEKAALLSPENQDLAVFVERIKQDDQK